MPVIKETRFLDFKSFKNAQARPPRNLLTTGQKKKESGINRRGGEKVFKKNRALLQERREIKGTVGGDKYLDGSEMKRD